MGPGPKPRRPVFSEQGSFGSCFIDEDEGEGEGEAEVEAEPMEETASDMKATSVLERCRFWPACANGNDCQYIHPSTPCK